MHTQWLTLPCQGIEKRRINLTWQNYTRGVSQVSHAIHKGNFTFRNTGSAMAWGWESLQTSTGPPDDPSNLRFSLSDDTHH
mmetsp:Transcript_3657/g.22942  ORF Transcript_3657/g.22942 Transcript_3657/m.22942 type:complete len:81 (-) Transcript_3657:1601-1843(-)